MLSNIPFTLSSLRAAYAAGTTPAEIVEEVYARIAAVNDPALFLHLRAKEDVLAEAQALTPDATDLLWGIPFAIKDNIDAAGMPTTAACPAYAYTPTEDAHVVARLRAAGGLLIGKTNLDQFATGLVGVRSPYGAPRNAVDPEIVPGGSSGGSGVAVGHGLVSFSLGTDTAGSGRVPAALNNIVGLKPTLGSLSARGVVPACRTLDTISIFALTVDDAYDAFSVAAGYDAADAYSRRFPVRPAQPTPSALRIGVPDAASLRFFGDAAQEAMFADACARLEADGAQIVPMDFQPLYDVADMLYNGAWVAERHTVIADLLKTQPDAVHPVTRKVIGLAETLSADDAFNGIYRLRELSRVAEIAMEGIDALCVPTIPTFYSVADLEADPIGPNSNLGTYTNFVNLLDMCGIAVPTAPRADGRPGSVTFLARAGEDALTAALARGMEHGVQRMLGGTATPLPAPQEPAPQLAEDEIAVVVCGAHMSGLPLNGELANRGGHLLRRTRTAPAYKFHALAGGPPARPGLLRVGAANGAAIEVEEWALPRAAMGDFMAGIPAPLCIGTVELEDGSRSAGFLVEPAGLEGARDITALGGWRAFLAESARTREPDMA